jgi:hypothetical protein
MWLRSLGALSVAVLFTNGLAFGQDAGSALGGGAGAAAYDWLSPAPLAWTMPGFNWSELPVKVYAHEYGGYNSNIFNAYPGTKLPPGVILGDYFLRTDVGASTKANIENQQFFVDMDYTTTNYRHDLSLDLHNHTFDAGMNWRVNELCNGTLIGTDKLVQAPQDVQIGPGIDILTSNVFNETGQCHLYQDINVIFNGGASTIRHSLLTSQPLDYNAYYGQGGLQYAWSDLDNIQFLVKYSNTDYVNTVSSPTAATVPQFVRLLNATVTYNYTYSDKINFSLMTGITEDVGGASTPRPIYSMTINYLPSEKLSFVFTASHLVSPPVSIIAATQINNVESVSVIYAWTTKFNLQASVAQTMTEAGNGASTPNNPTAFTNFGSNTLMSATIKASYSWTPFTSLVLSVQNSNRATNGTNLRTELIMLGLDYRPQ